MTRHDPTRAYRPRRAPTTVEDRDACALYAWLAKDARPSHEAIETALVALEKMLHRAGNVDGEGDGCGLTRGHTAGDLGRGGALAAATRRASPSTRASRWRTCSSRAARATWRRVKERARETMSRIGLRVLAERDHEVVTTALGPQAREEEPRLLAGGRADRGRARRASS